MGAIAELWAKIKGDTSHLQGALRQAKGMLGNLDATVKKTTGLNLVSWAAIGGAVYSAAKFILKCNEESIKYANTVQDMARVTGMYTDEAQRLIQVADDVRIGQAELQKALEFANKSGYETSIDSLKKMAAQYEKLATPTEKAAFLVERFGRAGQGMGKLFEIGAEGIGAAIGKVKDYLVLSESQLTALENERVAIDNATDAWTGFKTQLGAMVAPVVTSFIENVLVPLLDKLATLSSLVPEVGRDIDILNNALYYQGQGMSIDEAIRKATEAEDAFEKSAAQINDDARQTPDLITEWISPLDGVKKSIGEAAYDMLVMHSYWAAIKDKTVIITIIQRFIQEGMSVVGFSNVGGVVTSYEGQKSATRHATGGAASGGILVGERGPEVLNLGGGNGQVAPNESASIRLDRGSMEELSKLIADKMAMARA
jgi:hypothetical protein